MDLKKTPFVRIPTIRIDIRQEINDRGERLLHSTVPLRRHPYRLTARLAYWAKKTPDRVFLAQRDATGGWETITYAETLDRVRRLAQFLLNSPVSAERPLAILSENSIEHGLLALAALHVGLPYSPLAPAYSLRSTDFSKLRRTVELLTPGLIFVQNDRVYEKALHAVAPNVERIAVEATLPGTVPFGKLLKTEATPAVEAAYRSIRPDTIAKILFTSGSTGWPKGVVNTHGNISTNWQQITQTFPFMRNGGLTLIDWLPWNHTYGGNHNFGLVLFNGGTLYIDGGNPTPAGIDTTLRNLRDIAPTVCFNVPRGFEQLLAPLREDESLRRHFFSRLRLLFYAGASMPQHVWDALETLSWQTTGKRHLIACGLGMTEASPSALFNTQYNSCAGMLGVPVPGLQVKLVPDAGKLEARFRGPNIMPGYWRDPAATALAFDEEGYYRTGDAVCVADPGQPNRGLIFDGRLTEDFKLSTGTWVSVGILRAKLLYAGKGLIQDAVITGHDRSFLGALIFPDLNHSRKLAGLDEHADASTLAQAPSVRSALQAVLDDVARQSTGSSTLIRRALFAGFLPSIDKGEITDKGTINQRMVLANHPAEVEMLYAPELAPEVVEIQV